MRVAPLFALLLIASFAPSRAATDFEEAKALFDTKRYPEAREAFEKIVAAEPKSAAACHYLGRVIILRKDSASLEEGVKWLGKAVELEPANATYLGVYGGALLTHADRSRSLSAATRGRDMLEKSVALDPGQLDAREALFRFYFHAPWPIGSSAKAKAHLAALRERDPMRADELSVVSKIDAKDFAGAFKLCDELIAARPNNYVALYQYGRTAAMSGQNLDRGIARLRECLALTPPTPASPTHSHVWNRIGNLEEKRQHAAEARAAYEMSLRLDPNNRQASDALAKLK
jgi:tetratricopeptide (TPR) repeat protein